eukprot:gene10649-10808_t
MNEIYRITPPSGVILNERKYPVITNNPTWSQICSKSHNTRPGMVVGILMTGTAALAHIVEVSAARLLGVTENGPEYKALVEKPGK